MIDLAGFQTGMNPKSRVEHSNETYQNHEAGGEKIHDEFQRVLEMKGPNEGFDAQYKKKKRQKAGQDHFPPPEA
jgi:hypothetical protein